MSATILIGKSAAPGNWGDVPTHLRRRAEKLLSVTERNCLLESHSRLASLMRGREDQPNVSLSRRGGYFAVALHPFEKIGIDLEKVIAAEDIEAVASCYFPASLYKKHRHLPAAKQPRHFTACWSAPEAVAKLRALPLESAGASLETAVLYQSRIEADMVLSIALNQENLLQLTMLSDTLTPSVLTHVSPLFPKGCS